MAQAVKQEMAVRIIGSVDELMDVTEQLADLLDEESEYLRTMQLQRLAPLHEEKIRLTQMMEQYQQLLATKPEIVQQASPEARERFAALAAEFTEIVKENFRLNAVARTVNQRVVQAISDAMFETQRPSTYNRQGNTSMSGGLAMSLNLNQKA